MKKRCHSDRKPVFLRCFGRAFTLPETAAAIVILALICTSIVIIFDRSIVSAANSALRVQAFEVARENMEKLLASSSVEESVEYGYSEKYPVIEWQTTVETFYEPITNRLWAKAVCSANYIDSDNQQQQVELTNWITDLGQQQVLEIIKRKLRQKEELVQADRLVGTIEDAAEYAGVNIATVQQWVDNGMPVTEDGAFIKDYLDLYKKTGGNPPAADKAILNNIFPFLIPSSGRQPTNEPQKTKPEDKLPDKDPLPKEDNPIGDEGQQSDPTICGKSMSELNKMSFIELWEFVKNCPELNF
jgi:type II secretory pathway pseudopilin PulG